MPQTREEKQQHIKDLCNILKQNWQNQLEGIHNIYYTIFNFFLSHF